MRSAVLGPGVVVTLTPCTGLNLDLDLGLDLGLGLDLDLDFDLDFNFNFDLELDFDFDFDFNFDFDLDSNSDSDSISGSSSVSDSQSDSDPDSYSDFGVADSAVRGFLPPTSLGFGRHRSALAIPDPDALHPASESDHASAMRNDMFVLVSALGMSTEHVFVSYPLFFFWNVGWKPVPVQ